MGLLAEACILLTARVQTLRFAESSSPLLSNSSPNAELDMTEPFFNDEFLTFVEVVGATQKQVLRSPLRNNFQSSPA